MIRDYWKYKADIILPFKRSSLKSTGKSRYVSVHVCFDHERVCIKYQARIQKIKWLAVNTVEISHRLTTNFSAESNM